MLVVNKEGQQQLVMATTTSAAAAGASNKAGYAAFPQTPAPPTPQAASVPPASMPPTQPQLPQSPSAASAAASERRNVAEILASLSGLKPIDLPSTAGMATFKLFVRFWPSQFFGTVDALVFSHSPGSEMSLLSSNPFSYYF